MPNAKLPSETWREIFHHAVSVHLLLDTEWSYDTSDHIWHNWMAGWGEFGYPNFKLEDTAIQTRQALVQVCREWRSIAVEFLFEVIQFPEYHSQDGGHAQLRRLIQIFKQSATRPEGETHSHSPGYGWWTKRIDCPNLLLNEENLQPFMDLLEECPNLEILVIQPGWMAPIDRTTLVGTLHNKLPHSLRRFSYIFKYLADEIDINPVPMNIPLHSLDIAYGDRILQPSPSPTLCTAITSLSLWFTFGLLRPISNAWHFPNLRQLSLLNILPEDSPVLAQFVQRHRNTLTSLFIILGSPRGHLVPALLHAAPRLHSLTFQAKDLVELPRETPFPGVTHIAILPDRSEIYHALGDAIHEFLEHKTFPSLLCLHLLHGLAITEGDEGNWGDSADELARYGIELKSS